MAPNVFSVPVFLVVFRETLETAIIVSVLLAFLKQTLDGQNRDAKVYKKLCKQVWLGTGLGFFICLVIAGAIIGVFYTVGRDSWAAHEYYYEGSFCILASVIITLMGFALLRIGRLQEKWRVKLAKTLEAPIKSGTAGSRIKKWFEKYAMFFLPFITILREGVEAIVFITGVSFTATPTSIPLPVVIGLIVGALVGYIIFKCGSLASIQLFLVVSTCFLYLVAAGLFSRGVWFFETQEWNNVVGGDAAELGSGPGSYDIDRSVWHVNCCNPQLNGGGGWGVFNAILGWNNSATYGSVISYNVYWIVVASGFFVLKFHESNGRLPFAKKKANRAEKSRIQSRRSLLEEQTSH